MTNKKTILLASFIILIYLMHINIIYAQELPCSPACQDSMDCDGDGVNAIECGGGDCDDTNPNTYLAADEICDGLDNDCDGYIANNERDKDNDGVIVCKGDCDDTNPNTYLAADEICDGLDNDCDGYIANNERDRDQDGFVECNPDVPNIYGNDCDDNNAAIYPGAPEICDFIDNNCNGLDGFNNDSDGYTTCEGDCNDTNQFINPSINESENNGCNDGIDNNCNEMIDCQDPDCSGNPSCEGIPEYPSMLLAPIIMIISIILIKPKHNL